MTGTDLVAPQTVAPAAQQDRRGWLGGSDIAAVCGISPFKSALDVYMEKTGKPLDYERVGAEEERLYFGKLMEPVVIQALADRYGIVVCNRNQRYIHPDHEWMRAEIDAEYFDFDDRDCNVEIKNVNAYARKSWGEEGTDEAPDYYVAQSMWGQECKGNDFTLAAAFFGGCSLKMYPIERDGDVIDWLKTEGERFWTRNVIADIPPEPRTKDDAQRMLAKMPGFRWVPNVKVIGDLGTLRALKSEIADKKREAEAIETRIVCSFAAASVACPDDENRYTMVDESGRKLASWNRQTRKSYTVAENSFHVLRLAGESNG